MTADAKQQPRRVKVRLKSRASLTRKRTAEIVEVEAPSTREGQINKLTALVDERFPGATLRVFHEGAGSFTRDDLHVVAAFQGLGDVDPPVPADDAGEDDELRQLPLSA